MRILFTASDPGGCDSIVAVMKEVSTKHECICLVDGKAVQVMERSGLSFERTSVDSCAERFAQIQPDFIIAATSMGLSVDKLSIGYGNDSNIPSLAIIDYWSNYWPRFKHEGNEYLPTQICVVDELMRNEMLGEGFSEDKIQITGNPRFDTFAQPLEKTDSKTVVFVSQPFTEMERSYGFTEMDALRDLVSVLAETAEPSLIIRPHPKESSEKFSHILATHNWVSLDDSSPMDELLISHNVFVGMTSMVLLQAVLCGRSVVVYQPNVQDDKSILQKLGVVNTLTEISQLREVISERRDGSNIDITALESLINGEATPNVITLMERLLL